MPRAESSEANKRSVQNSLLLWRSAMVSTQLASSLTPDNNAKRCGMAEASRKGFFLNTRLRATVEEKLARSTSPGDVSDENIDDFRARLCNMTCFGMCWHFVASSKELVACIGS